MMNMLKKALTTAAVPRRTTGRSPLLSGLTGSSHGAQGLSKHAFLPLSTFVRPGRKHASPASSGFQILPAPATFGGHSPLAGYPRTGEEARRSRHLNSVGVLAAAVAFSTSATVAATAGAADEPSGVESAKRQAAFQAVDDFVRHGMVVGVGSGSTVVHAVDRLDQLAKQGLSIVCVPTSFQSEQLCKQAGLTVSDLNSHPVIDVCIDGADECDKNLNLIKGGGGCQLQEKMVAANAKTFVVIADFRKQSDLLGTQWRKGVPIEVVPGAYVAVSRQLEKLGGKPVLRQAKAKAGPVVTDNGNFILDTDFGGIADPAALNRELIAIVGVVETGLFCNMATRAYFGQADESVTCWGRE